MRKQQGISSTRHPVMTVGIAVALVLTLLPLVVLVLQCFLTRWTGIVPTEWTLSGLATFAKKSGKIMSVTGSTFALGISAALIATAIACAASRYLCVRKIKHVFFWELVIMLALFIPATVCGVGMRTVFFKIGIVNTWGSVLFALVIANVPYCTKIMLETTRSVGIGLEEEARVLGVNPLRAYFVGTLPRIIPGVMTSMGFGFMTAVNQYFYVVFMGTGRVNSLISTIVMPAVTHSPMPISATYCVYFILFTVVVFVIFQALANLAVERTGKELGAS